MKSEPTEPLVHGALVYEDGSYLQVLISQENFVHFSGQWATRSPYLWRRYCAPLSEATLQEIKTAWEAVETPKESSKERPRLARFTFEDRPLRLDSMADLDGRPALQNAVRVVLETVLSSFPKRFGKDLARHPLRALVEPTTPPARSPD